MARNKLHISSINWGSTPSGSAAGGGSFLAINASGRLVLDQGGGSPNLDIISGSSLTYHNLSGSSGTFNFIDTDRIVTNQISGSTSTFNNFSGSFSIFHRLSGSTATINLLQSDRIVTNQISGSTAIANTISGSVGIIHNISGSTGKFNLVDVDRITTNQISGSTATINTFSGSVGIIHNLSGSTGKFNLIDVDRIAANQISGSTSTFNNFSGSFGVLHRLSGSTGTLNLLESDRVESKQINTTSLTASFAKITSLDVENILSRTITKESLEIRDNLIIAAISGSKAGDFVGAGFQVGGTSGIEGTGSNPLMSLTLGSRSLTGDSMIINVDGQAGASFKSGSVTMSSLGTPGMRFGVTGSISGSLVQAKKAEIGLMNIQHLSSSKASVQNLHVYGEISGSGTNTLIKKNHLHKNIVQNNTDAHGGLSFSGGRISVGVRKMIFVRSDGSNISGSTPTKGMFATHAIPTPYTTASLSAQPQSGSLMVYLNGVLLHGDHPGENPHGPTSADYRVTTSSNDYKVLIHEELALDSDDILTVTFLSGSGLSS